MDHHELKFVPSGRGQAQCPPDPRYPEGIAVVGAREDETSCTVKLPYPAPECGVHVVKCTLCMNVVAITAAGRPDDPVSVTMKCKKIGGI